MCVDCDLVLVCGRGCHGEVVGVSWRVVGSLLRVELKGRETIAGS